MSLTDLEDRLAAVDAALEHVQKQVARVTTNQEVTIKLVKAILKELELRRDIEALEKDLETTGDTGAPSALGG